MKLKLFFAILLFYACIDDDQIFIENDITPPSISIIGDNSINIYQNTIYMDAGATAIDDVDGDLTASIITTGSCKHQFDKFVYNYVWCYRCCK